MASVNLIIQTAFVGDLLLSIPLMRHLKRLDPARPLVLVCRRPLGDFFLRSGLVDRIIEVDKQSRQSRRELRLKLRNLEVNWLVCPHESFSSALLARATRAEKKIGYHHWWNFWIFSERYARPKALPEAVRQLSLLQDLNANLRAQIAKFSQKWDEQFKIDAQMGTQDSIAHDLPEWASMRVSSFSADRWDQAPASVQAFEKQGLFTNPTAFLAPASVWATKMWRAEGYAKVGRALVERGMQVVVLGAPSEIEICEKVSAQIPGSINLAGRSDLFEMAWLLTRGKVLICNDSGAMHMGAVSGIPIVSVWGPTVLEFGYRPWSTRAKIIQRKMDCRPCGKHGPQKCPIGTHACMKEIEWNEVLSEIPS